MVGDVIVVSYGAIVPADALILSAEGCTCDESMLTGEPDPLPKSAADATNIDSWPAPDPFLRAGSSM